MHIGLFTDLASADFFLSLVLSIKEGIARHTAEMVEARSSLTYLKHLKQSDSKGFRVQTKFPQNAIEYWHWQIHSMHMSVAIRPEYPIN